MDKPYGMLLTEELQRLKDYEPGMWDYIMVKFKVDTADIYVDERSGELICELFGSLTEKQYWKYSEIIQPQLRHEHASQ
jgi:hypothetical protein